MKNKFTMTLVLLISLPLMAQTTVETTDSFIKDEQSSTPAMNQEQGPDTEMIEAEEYDEPLTDEELDESRLHDQEKMEEKTYEGAKVLDSEKPIDYSDRTRTNRERKALDTGSDASDDQ